MNKIKKLILSNPITKRIALAARHFQLSYKLFIKTIIKLKKFKRKGKVIQPVEKVQQKLGFFT